MTGDYTRGDRLLHIGGERAVFIRYSEDLGTRTALVTFDGAEEFPTHVFIEDIRPA